MVSEVATDPNPNSDPGPNQVGAAVASEVAKIDAVLAGLQAEREAGSGARDTAELREELQGLTHRLGGKAGRGELLPTLALDLAQTLTLTLTLTLAPTPIPTLTPTPTLIPTLALAVALTLTRTRTKARGASAAAARASVAQAGRAERGAAAGAPSV